jgi:putative transposase
MSEGWALGSEGFKAALMNKFDLAPLVRAWEVDGAREIARARWQDALGVALHRLGKTASYCSTGRKSAPWKIVLAVHLKHSTQASNRWLTDQLHMGSAVAVSQNSALSATVAARINC